MSAVASSFFRSSSFSFPPADFREQRSPLCPSRSAKFTKAVLFPLGPLPGRRVRLRTDRASFLFACSFPPLFFLSFFSHVLPVPGNALRQKISDLPLFSFQPTPSALCNVEPLQIFFPNFSGAFPLNKIIEPFPCLFPLCSPFHRERDPANCRVIPEIQDPFLLILIQSSCTLKGIFFSSFVARSRAARFAAGVYFSTTPSVMRPLFSFFILVGRA